MTRNNRPQGVMDTQFARDRQQMPHVIYRFKTRARALANAAARHLDPDASLNVLDFGAADGRTLLELYAVFPKWNYFGVEYSEELLQAAPVLPPSISLTRGDVMNLPDTVTQRQYDMVSALALLEHLPDPGKAVKEAARALKPGGIFVATCPIPYWDKLAERFGLIRGGFHETDMDRSQLINVVTDAGLELVSYERFVWAPIGVLPNLKIPVAAGLSDWVDRMIRPLRIFDGLFVNQCIVGRKP
ncbi:MAG: class I SAM-dependent methyltransferase [Candidatus Hydrogenedentes bacterium]|nr:class I SAM-dependent methyltransferase [Candidatus Hydrogenedentota bacterium]